MKRILLTILIAAVTGTSGYYMVKNDLLASLSPSALESTNKSNRQYSAEVTVQINPYRRGHNGLGVRPEQAMMTRPFFQTQLSIISSEIIITKAIQDYKLAELFHTDEATLLKNIKANLELW